LDAANPQSYPGSGTSWADLSGNGNTGTLINGPTFNSGNSGSIVFDGVDDYVNCGNRTTLNITNSVTLISWFKLNQLPSSVGNPNLIDKWDWPNNLRVYSIGTEGGALSSMISSDGSFTNRLVVLDTEPVKIDEYYFICMTYDGQKLSFFKNNTIIGTSSYNTTYPIFDSPSTETWIGRSRDSGQGGRWISANVGSSQIYNRALSASEVLQNYEAVKSRFGL
jgi:hypothetical protein